eukprot:8510042-Pyramimonas_sp.AAC.1
MAKACHHTGPRGQAAHASLVGGARGRLDANRGVAGVRQPALGPRMEAGPARAAGWPGRGGLLPRAVGETAGQARG